MNLVPGIAPENRPRKAVLYFVAAMSLALSFLVLGLSAPRADAYIYWRWIDGGFTQSGIGRAENDGTGSKERLITGLPIGYTIATGPGGLYWTQWSATQSLSVIGHANFDGSDVEQAYRPTDNNQESSGLGLDSDFLYYTTWHSNTVGRVGLSDSIAAPTWINGLTGDPGVTARNTAGVDSDATHVYWGNWRFDDEASGTIGRADLDGNNANNNFINNAGAVYGVAVNDSAVFWANTGANGAGTIGRANIDGTGVNNSYISGINSPNGVALDSSHIYWPSPDSSGIGRAGLGGSNVNERFIPVENSVQSVAVDSLTSPALSLVRTTKRSLTVRVGCAKHGGCTIALSGNKVGTTATLRTKRVSFTNSNTAKVTLSYTSGLRRALAKGGRVRVSAVKSGGGDRTITVRVPK